VIERWIIEHDHRTWCRRQATSRPRAKITERGVRRALTYAARREAKDAFSARFAHGNERGNTAWAGHYGRWFCADGHEAVTWLRGLEIDDRPGGVYRQVDQRHFPALGLRNECMQAAVVRARREIWTKGSFDTAGECAARAALQANDRDIAGRV
jgi:hypothetical protein